MIDTVVVAGSVEIAVREFGGTGSAVLLLHGAGNTLVDMAPLASQLTAGHRVVGMDLRNHGRSGDGPWKWDAVLDDIAAVIGRLELSKPILVGHSLGGMLAAMYTQRYDDAVAAVNLDGHGTGTPGQYDVETTQAVRLLAQLRAATDASVHALSQPLTGEQVAVARAAWIDSALALGLDPAVAAEAFDRKLIGAGDATYRSRQAADRLEEMRMAIDALDVLQLYRDVRVPQMVYVANSDRLDATLPGELADLVAARRRWLITSLQQLAAVESLVHVIEIDSTHGLIYEQPELIAAQVDRFAADLDATATVLDTGKAMQR